MYFSYPEHEEAYHCPHQYLLGENLLVAPVTHRLEEELGRSKWAVWLPPQAGGWFDFFSGAHYEDGRWTPLYPRLEDTPVFARAGTILPLKAEGENLSVDLPETLEVRVYPGADGRFELFEDDGLSERYLGGAYRTTLFEQAWEKDQLNLIVHPAQGDLSVGPRVRSYRFVFFGLDQRGSVRVTRDGEELTVSWKRDRKSGALTLEEISAGVDARLQIRLEAGKETLMDLRDPREKLILELIRTLRSPTYIKIKLQEDLPAILADPSWLERYLPGLTPVQVRALAELTSGSGCLRLPDSDHQDRVLLWNPAQFEGFRYRLPVVREKYTGLDRFEGGVVPPFKVILPEKELTQEFQHWVLDVDYFGLGWDEHR